MEFGVEHEVRENFKSLFAFKVPDSRERLADFLDDRVIAALVTTHSYSFLQRLLRLVERVMATCTTRTKFGRLTATIHAVHLHGEVPTSIFPLMHLLSLRGTTWFFYSSQHRETFG